MAEDVELINVRSSRADTRTALWEVHPDHPTGEAYVAGPVPVTVAVTPQVIKTIAEGEIEVIDDATEITDLDSARRSGDLVRQASAAGEQPALSKTQAKRQARAARDANRRAEEIRRAQAGQAPEVIDAESSVVEPDDDDEDESVDGSTETDTGA